MLETRSAAAWNGTKNDNDLINRCHLRLVHRGTLTVSGDASVGGALSWEASGFQVLGPRARA